MTLLGRTSKAAMVTRSDNEPRPKILSSSDTTVNITWLLSQIADDASVGFGIDRLAAECRTPRRNPQATNMP